MKMVDACDAWATEQRFTLIHRHDETGGDRLRLLDLETKDGRSIPLLASAKLAGASPSVTGEAEVTPEGGRVRYTDPAAKEGGTAARHPPAVLPAIRTLATARAGSLACWWRRFSTAPARTGRRTPPR
ncbi:cell envelope integrity EipB family protein [Siccirubricoccus sp. G192]|uniref:cell envelope integrity EipB family protein n=1 Tax=Siccirubricoccus sp. G192 TaxID=2849651 RepID=UPI001C2BC3B4|nr:cell envelope integrity EipB family protein [Siccirubricoccus sp. G192]MBV1800299.1 cell envelope integrity EipB family protein [Siccirubricoccus sp. G192]